MFNDNNNSNDTVQDARQNGQVKNRQRSARIKEAETVSMNKRLSSRGTGEPRRQVSFANVIVKRDNRGV